jgi:CheY-like chemotaxis protein
MRRVHLVHWDAEEAKEKAAALREAGYQVAYGETDGARLFRKLREKPPDAVVIDLGRLPSHGRDLGLALRQAKQTRQVPLVFVEGDAKKTKRVKRLLPDATFAPWRGVRGALKKALAKRPADPVVPRSRLEGYSGTPLPKKLGIQPETTVALIDAPPGFEDVLGDLPPKTSLRRGTAGPRDLTLWFVTTVAALERRFPQVAARSGPAACGSRGQRRRTQPPR